MPQKPTLLETILRPLGAAAAVLAGVAALSFAALPAAAQDDPAPESAEEGSTEGEEEEKTYPLPKRDCVDVNRLSTYGVINPSYALFVERPKTQYLVHFKPRCTGLRFSNRIAAGSRTGRICGGAGETIKLSRYERCFVRNVFRVESEEQARYWVTRWTEGGGEPNLDEEPEPSEPESEEPTPSEGDGASEDETDS